MHAAKTPVKNRLLALDANSKFPLSVMPDGLQRRVSGNCVVGSAVRVINSDGSVTCQNIPSGVPSATAIPTPTRNPADITGVIAGNGLTGGGTTGDVTLALDQTTRGIISAAALADCKGTGASLIRSFNNINDVSISISDGGGLGPGHCTIDFGFDLSSKFIVATALGEPATSTTVAIYSVSGTSATFRRWGYSNDALNGKIYVLVY